MITELRTLLAVARIGTFAGAGDAIGLTQSAVSSQIKRLEDHFGYALFDRTGRSAQLNATARALLPQVEALLKNFEQLGQQSPSSSPVRLRLGAIATIHTGLLTRALAGFMKANPQVHLQLVPGTSMDFLDQLDSGGLDAALMIRPPFGMVSQLTWQPLLHEPFMLLAHRNMPDADWRSALQSQAFVRYDRRSFGGRMVERFLRQQQITPNERLEMDDLPGLVAMVGQGIGVAIAPMADSLLPLPIAVKAMSLGEHTFYREVGLLRPRSHTHSAVLHQLTAHLQASASTPKNPAVVPSAKPIRKQKAN